MKHKSVIIINLFIVILLLSSSSNIQAAENAGQEVLRVTSAISAEIETMANSDDLAHSLNLPIVVSNAIFVHSVIPDTTIVLSDETTSSLSSISEDGSVFTFSESSSEIELLEPGEIIVGDPSTAAPDGFLRKVISTTTSYDGVIVETEVATLEEAITQGVVSVNETLKPGDVQDSVVTSGVTLNTSPMAIERTDFDYNLHNVILYDHDGNTSTTYDQIRANGKIALESSYIFKYKIGWKFWKEPEITFTQTTAELAELEIIYESGYQLQKEVEIARHHFSPVTFWVGPVPVVFVPVLTIYIGVDGIVYTSVTSRVNQSASLTYGVKYDDGWSPVGNFTNDFSFTTPSLDANLSVRGYTGTGLSLLLYGVAGPHADLVPYLLLQADVNSTPWWQLYAGLDVLAGVKVDVLGKTVADYHTKVIDYSVLLAQAADSPPNTSCYTLSIFHTGMGTDPVASPSNSTGCSSGEYVAGEIIQLSGAVPDSGWQIDSWTGTDNDSSPGSTNSRTMPAYNLSLSVNYTEISSSISVTMDQAYTTDWLKNPKTTFRPGEAIVLHFVATNHESSNVDVTYDWDTYDLHGAWVGDLSYHNFEVSMSPGEDTWRLDRGVPPDALEGVYTYYANVSFPSGYDSESENFEVQGSPISINSVEAVTCRSINNTFPVGRTTNFTSADENVFVWIAWEGSSGPHAVSYVWYRPGGSLHADHSEDLNASDSLNFTWDSVPTSEMGPYPGEWHVDIYIDGSYETTLYFTYGG